jgi:hypothetical protein
MCAQQAPDSFRWIDFHSDPQSQPQSQSQQDQDVVAWVTRSLEAEKWTAIREIGVEFDAALVVTTLRATPQSPAGEDSFTVWSASLTSHAIEPLVKGMNLRWLEWMRFANGAPTEPAILYDNCVECTAETYFTAFDYDSPRHLWMARWMRGGQGVAVWGGSSAAGVTVSQVYAVVSDANGIQSVSTWNHIDFGGRKAAQDFVYHYDLDPFSGLERTEAQTGKDAEATKQRLCMAQNAGFGLARGQDSALCKPYGKPHPERKPVTTPPANNRGQSTPPGSRH